MSLRTCAMPLSCAVWRRAAAVYVLSSCIAGAEGLSSVPSCVHVCMTRLTLIWCSASDGPTGPADSADTSVCSSGSASFDPQVLPGSTDSDQKSSLNGRMPCWQQRSASGDDVVTGRW